MYRIFLRPVFFLFAPETIHHFVVRSLKILFAIPFVPSLVSRMSHLDDARLQRTMMGLVFKNPVGLAAGFDKNAVLINEMACLGFGFIEIGTVTPLAQPGNPKPRMFRLPKDEALLNRMGFNNDGVEVIAKRLSLRNKNIIVGANIGKNKNTPNEKAADDYVTCFEKLAELVDYFTVNVSSPNTPGLRSLQDKEPLTDLLTRLTAINTKRKIRRPILLKISPDLSNAELDDVIDITLSTGIDGIIATNTTLSRAGLRISSGELDILGAGGISGLPLKTRSTEVIRYIHEKSKGKILVVGSGGIHSPSDASEKMNNGAALIELYTGFIYEGPGLVKRINRKILDS